MEYREVSREKQRLHEIVNETKINLEERVNQVAKLDKELKDQKRLLKEKTRTFEEVCYHINNYLCKTLCAQEVTKAHTDRFHE